MDAFPKADVIDRTSMKTREDEPVTKRVDAIDENRLASGIGLDYAKRMFGGHEGR